MCQLDLFHLAWRFYGFLHSVLSPSIIKVVSEQQKQGHHYLGDTEKPLYTISTSNSVPPCCTSAQRLSLAAAKIWNIFLWSQILPVSRCTLSSNRIIVGRGGIHVFLNWIFLLIRTWKFVCVLTWLYEVHYSLICNKVLKKRRSSIHL